MDSCPVTLNDLALRRSESRYRRLFESAQDGILIINAETAQIEDVNPYLIDMLGYSHAEFLGKKLWEVGAFTDRTESKEMFATLQSTGYVRYENLPLKTKAGAKIDVEFVSNSYDCEGITVIQCNIRNITERTVAEAKVLRHTHLYAALSQCNRAVVYCRNEVGLFVEICRAAVQFGGMKMAWVGMTDSETRMLIPVASFGDDTAYLKDIKISVDAGSPFGQGPTGTAVREDQSIWHQDFQADPSTAAWHERARNAGFAASAALPLHRQGVVVGALTLYVGKVNSFDELARNLLDEMAADISFALDNFARQTERQLAREDIKYKNTILQTQLETSLDAILVVDEGGRIASFNQNFIALWHLSPQLVAARVDAPVLRAVAEQVVNPEEFAARVQSLTERQDCKSNDEILLKDGRTIDRYSAPATGADGRYYGRIWYFRDITERKKAEVSIKYLNRVLSVLSGINALIVRVHDRGELYREACNIAVDAGGFRMAMLCMVDPITMTIVSIASAGKDERLLSKIKDRLSSTNGVSGSMVGLAISEKQVVVANDSLTDSRVVFANEYAESGVHSMVIVPLIVADKVVGTISLYASEIDFFHEQELK